MSGNPTQPTTTSRRQRLLTHFTSKGRASSPLLSPSPESRSNQTATSSSAQTKSSSSTLDTSSSTALPGPVLTDLLTAGAAPLPSPQTTSTPSSNPNLLRDVLKRLSDEDQATLQNYVCHNTGDINLTLKQALVAAKEKQQCCIEKRWTFTVTGRTIAVKEKADKVVGWLNRFRAVGDVVANVDPVHVGLPWAGIRLLLEVKARTCQRTSRDLTVRLTGCRV